MKFYGETRVMPVIWHQSLLAFAQRLVFLVNSPSHTISALLFNLPFLALNIELKREISTFLVTFYDENVAINIIYFLYIELY